jgi:hypothetical protein
LKMESEFTSSGTSLMSSNETEGLSWKERSMYTG